MIRIWDDMAVHRHVVTAPRWGGPGDVPSGRSGPLLPAGLGLVRNWVPGENGAVNPKTIHDKLSTDILRAERPGS